MSHSDQWDQLQWRVLWDLAQTISREQGRLALLESTMVRICHHTGALAAVGLAREEGRYRRLCTIPSAPLHKGGLMALESTVVTGLVAQLWPEWGEQAAYFALAPTEDLLLLFLLGEGPHPDWSARLSPLLPNLARSIALLGEREELAQLRAHTLSPLSNPLLLMALPLPLFTQDSNGHLVWGNAPFTELLGIKLADHLALGPTSWWPGEGGEQMHLRDQRLLQTGGSYRERFDMAGRGGILCCKGAVPDSLGRAGLVGALVHLPGEALWEQDELLESVMTALSLGMAHRDSNTREHEVRVMDLASRIADRLGLSSSKCREIALAAMVHDVGFVRVPVEILVRPRRLTPLEFEFVKQHARDGFELLKTLPLHAPIAQMVLQHHENLDGSGYPQGLKGEAIMLEARILRVADTVEAMLSHRPFRHQYDTNAVLAELRRYSGLWFDARVVEAAAAILGSGYRLPEGGEK